MIKRIEQSGSFRAKDENGNEYVIYEFTDIEDVQSYGNLGAEAEGMKSYRLKDETIVNLHPDGTFDFWDEEMEVINLTRID